MPGVAELLSFFDARGITSVCITNNGSMTPHQYEEKLRRLNIHIPAAQILTSAVVTAHILRSTYPPGTTIYAIGMEGLHDALFGDGYFHAQERTPHVVVLGPDFAITYDKLKYGCLAIRAGADFILTNPDVTLPTEEGLIPDAGALAAGLAAATGVAPRVIGKPEPAMFQTALALVHGEPSHAIVVGDRLETDILGAHRAGLRSVLVLTGVSQRADLSDSPIQPDMVVDDLPQLLMAFQQSYA